MIHVMSSRSEKHYFSGNDPVPPCDIQHQIHQLQTDNLGELKKSYGDNTIQKYTVTMIEPKIIWPAAKLFSTKNPIFLHITISSTACLICEVKLDAVCR